MLEKRLLKDVREKAIKSMEHLRGLTWKDLDLNNSYEGKMMIEIHLKSY